MPVDLMYRKFLLVLLACLPGLVNGAQPPILPQDLTVRSWTQLQGLPNDSVTSVLQARDGYLWVGTAGGLARFDGVRFVLIRPTLEKSDTVFVTALCEDSTGRLWVGTQHEGLMYLTNGVLNSFEEERNGASDETVNSIAEDTSGCLWIGTSSGLTALHGGKLTHYTTKDGLPNDFISSVHVARSGTVWITTRGGMCQFKNGKLNPYPFQTASSGRSPESLGVYEDRRGNLWAFGDTYLVNLTEGTYHLNHFGGGDMTSSTRIWSLCEGRRGELWIGTSGKGLYCFANNEFVPVTLRTGGLSSDVRALCEDREGNLWLGTFGSGLVRLQPRNMRLLDTSAGLPDRSALCLAVGSKGKTWVGLDRGGLYSGTGEHFEKFSGELGQDLQNLVSTVCVISNSDVWVGTPGAGLYHLTYRAVAHYTTANGLSDNNVLVVAADSEAAVWVGTAAGGVHRFKDGFPQSFGVAEGLPARAVTAMLPMAKGEICLGFDDGQVWRGTTAGFKQIADSIATGQRAIRSIYADDHGKIWLGTDGGHLVCAEKQGLVNWNLNLGAPDYALLGILGDVEGDLWVSTSSAIYHIAQSDIAATLLGQGTLRPQRLIKAESPYGALPTYGWPRAVKSSDEKLWFALATGVAVFDLRAPVNGLVEPPVVIEEVMVNEHPLSLKDEPQEKIAGAFNGYRFPSSLRSLKIQFTALSFSMPEKIRFRHRLEGYESDWVTTDQLRSVPYGKLPYGNYRFRVQAGYEGGSWFDNEAAFSFIIPIPIWRTGWAQALYVLIAIAIVATVARVISTRRLGHRLAVLAAQQAMERERMRIAQDMHDEIGSKLTKISFMSERAIRELDGHAPVANKLESIARTSRDLLQSLDEIVWAVNPHNDTLEHLAVYLGQYANEYLQNTAVNCELSIARGLPDYPLSAEDRHNLFLAFEESLNNALKHGRASSIRIEMFVEAAQFRIQIRDNGCGFDPGNLNKAANGGREGNGLRNMRQRLSLLGGEFTIASEVGKGTLVSFSVPLKTKAGSARKK